MRHDARTVSKPEEKEKAAERFEEHSRPGRKVYECRKGRSIVQPRHFRPHGPFGKGSQVLPRFGELIGRQAANEQCDVLESRLCQIHRAKKPAVEVVWRQDDLPNNRKEKSKTDKEPA